MRDRRLLVPLAVALIALGAVTLPAVPAQPAGGGSELADLLDIGAKEVSVGVENGVARVSVARENFTGDDGAFVGYAPERGLMVVSERDQGQSRADLLRLQMQRLVEFRDVDGDGAFTPGVDEVVQTWRPRDLVWRLDPITTTAQGHRIVAHGAMPEGGLLSVALSTSGSYAASGGGALGVSDVALGFDVHAPRMATNGTSFALLVSDQQRGTIAGILPTESFPWQRVAAAEGASVQVNVTEPDRRPGDATRAETAFVTIAGAGAASGGAEADGQGRVEPAVDARTPPSNSEDVMGAVGCAFFFRCE